MNGAYSPENTGASSGLIDKFWPGRQASQSIE
jgi:hypothetical protein